MVIIITKLKSTLPDAAVRRLIDDHTEEFHDVEGLIQKYFCREFGTGNVAGVYVFRDRELAEGYLRSELAREIEAAYRCSEPAHVDKLDVLVSLHPDMRRA